MFIKNSLPHDYKKKYTRPFGSDRADDAGNFLVSKHLCVGHGALRNDNAFVIGGPGTGFGAAIVRPNLLQAYGSYIVRDSDVTLALTGTFLKNKGYRVRIFDPEHPEDSHHYNPFHYIKTTADVTSMTRFLTGCRQKDHTDPFFEIMKRRILESVILYLTYYRPEADRNFRTVSRLLDSLTEENGELAGAMTALKETNPDDPCVGWYADFARFDRRIRMEVIEDARADLTPFCAGHMQTLTADDDLDLDLMGDTRCALFLPGDRSTETHPILSLLIMQACDALFRHSEAQHRIPLAVPVQMFLADFGKMTPLPNWYRRLTVMKKYGISCVMCMDSIRETKCAYPLDWESVIGSCAMEIYLGFHDITTSQYISERLGNKRFLLRKRPVMTADEVRAMQNGWILCMIQGHGFSYDERYDSEHHPNAGCSGSFHDVDRQKYLYDFHAESSATKHEITNEKK